ncbi:MAG: hypothetical protein HY761_10085 [Candidatus Omnitrophica bacterium]|nr:hypothetical protein [Candidatus Omnitrophota bacterium]
MSYPNDSGIISDLTDGVDYIEAANVNTVKDELQNVKILLGTPGAAQSHLASLLDMIADNYTGWRVYKKDDDEIYVSVGAGIISNAAGSVRKLRKSTSVTTLSASNLDTGSFADDTYYYIYTVADAVGTVPVFIISASASSPTGYTHYRKIGWFYNESAAALDITSAQLGNIKDIGENPNSVSKTGTDDITTTSGSYVDMTDMTIKFVSNGRPVRITFNAPIYFNALSSNQIYINLEIDSTSKISRTYEFAVDNSEEFGKMSALIDWLESLSAGEHTIKIQWKVDAGVTAAQQGSTDGARVLIVEEA